MLVRTLFILTGRQFGLSRQQIDGLILVWKNQSLGDRLSPALVHAFWCRRRLHLVGATPCRRPRPALYDCRVALWYTIATAAVL